MEALIDQEEEETPSYSKKTFTTEECQFNIAVCQALNGNIPKAIKSLELAKKELSNEKAIQNVDTFIAMLQTEKKLLFARPPPSSQGE